MRKAENRKVRALASIIVISSAIIAFQGKSTWKKLRLGNSILSASICRDQLDIGRIELIDNERYYALYGHIDWSCGFTERYEKIGDTLILAGLPFEITQGILTDKYLVTDSTLIPIMKKDRNMTHIKILNIEKEQWP